MTRVEKTTTKHMGIGKNCANAKNVPFAKIRGQGKRKKRKAHKRFRNLNTDEKREQMRHQADTTTISIT